MRDLQSVSCTKNSEELLYHYAKIIPNFSEIILPWQNLAQSKKYAFLPVCGFSSEFLTIFLITNCNFYRIDFQ